MRIAVLTTYYPSPRHHWDGRSAHETVKELEKMAEVKVFFPLSRYPQWLRKIRPQADEDFESYQPAGPPVVYRYYPAAPLISRSFNAGSIVKALVEDVRAYQPDVILNYVAHPAGWAAVEIGRQLNIPVVLTATGSDLNRTPGPFIRWQRRQALKGADMVKTVSHDLARVAVRLGANPTDTLAVLNGCDTTRFFPQDKAAARKELDLPLDQEIALYVGRYDVRKGLIELIEAASELKPSRPNLHIYLLGSGPDERVLRDCIVQCNVQDSVHLVPPVTGERVALWNAACDLGVLPSYMEGCPNVVLETLASGRPVVGTNVGGIPELIDDSCGRLVPAHEVHPLAVAMDEVLSRPWDPQTIAKAHSRSWKDVAREMHEVMQEAVTRRRKWGSPR